MYILVNETKLTISNYGVKRNKITGQDILTVNIPKEKATANEIDTLCDYIATNAPTVYVFNDNEEIVQTLTGFSVKPHFGLTEAGVWELVVTCKSELEYQYGRLLDENARLTATVNEQAEIINSQSNVIISMYELLLAVQLAAADLYEKSLVTGEETSKESEVE